MEGQFKKMKAYKINQFIGSNLYGSFLVETEEKAKKMVELANKNQGDGIKLVYAGKVEAERKFRVWEMFNDGTSKGRLFNTIHAAQAFVDSINNDTRRTDSSFSGTAALDGFVLVEKKERRKS